MNSTRHRSKRSTLSHISKMTLIYPAAFWGAFAMAMLTLAMVFYLREVFHASATTIGWLSTLWALFYFVGCIVLRPLVRILPAKFVTFLAPALMMVFVIVLLSFPSLAVTVVAYSLLGFSLSLLWPPLMGWMSDGIEGVALSGRMAKYNFSWSTGVIFGSFAAGYLSDHDPILPIIATVVVLAGLSIYAILCLFLIPQVRSDHYHDKDSALNNKTRDSSTYLRFLAWVGVFSAYVVLGMITSIFPIYAREELLLNKTTIGVLMFARSTATAVFFILLGKTAFWHFKRWPMIVGQLVIIISLLMLIPARSSLYLTVILMIFGVIYAYSYTNSIFHGVSGSIERSRRMAVHEALLTAGMVAGSVIGGIIYQHYSMYHVIIACIGSTVVGIAVQLVFMYYFKDWISQPIADYDVRI